ncbi:hypothetical protein [Streptomyces sp. DH24]|uniref:hypothetical protein n=1 Tax=Streptomyces sp. DH24 TaxID=3040123 RepID=UPI0024424513|nr:hypothetical protein [Streptomyces sp. DH24]MDG9717416.1 hypothetical protein [Streptomyces sp. DH24]
MRTRTTITAGALLLATLTACSSSDGGKAAAKPSPSTTVTVSKETRYLTAARNITFNGTPRTDELEAYPPQWCEALEAGHSVQWMFDMSGGDLYPIGMDWGTAKPDANELLVVGVRAYCPEHLATVQDELRANGEY